MPEHRRSTGSRRRHPPRWATSALATGALLLAACSSAPEQGGDATATGEVASQVSAFAALTPAEQEQQLRTVSAQVERELLTTSGMERDLGGPDRATAAYQALTSTLVKRAAALRVTHGSGKFGAMAPSGGGDDVSLGGMIFVSWMLGSLSADSAVSASNDMLPGAKPERDVQGSSKNNDTTIIREASLTATSVDISSSVTIAGVTGKVQVKNTINPCPDANGQFTATVSVVTSATTGGGRVGSNNTVDIAITGRVDDDAGLAGYDVTTHSQAAEFGKGANKWAEATDTVTWTGDKVTAAGRTIGRTAGSATQTFAAQWANMGMITSMMLTSKVVEVVKAGWQSGRCVTLVPTTTPAKRTGLAPSATVSVVAPPRSKVDGGKVAGTVTATLVGGAAVDPAGSKVPADATFAYTAPGEKDKTGGVALEARSKRGVGKAQVDFDTNVRYGWVIGERHAPYWFTAVSCGSEKGPWRIKYELYGVPSLVGSGTIRLTYPGDRATPTTVPLTATGSDRGEFKGVGLPGGVRFSGNATGTLEPSGSRYLMTIKQSGGTTTGYAMGRTASAAWPPDGFSLEVRPASADTCPSR